MCNDYENNINEIYDFIHDENEFESDLFFLFSNIMKFAIVFYEDLEQNETKTKLIKKCNEIINEKLKIKDKKLFNHFVKIELDIEIVMQRWLKCLLSREFKINNVIILWDSILADNSKENYFNLIDYISLAMIIIIRNELIKKDQNESFQMLFKYPEIKNPQQLVKLAISYREFILDPNRKEEDDEENNNNNNNNNNNENKKDEIKINSYDINEFICDVDKDSNNNNNNNNSNNNSNSNSNNSNNNNNNSNSNNSNSNNINKNNSNSFNNYNNSFNNYNKKNNFNDYFNNSYDNNNNSTTTTTTSNTSNNIDYNNYTNNKTDLLPYEQDDIKLKKSNSLFSSILDKTKIIIQEPFKTYKKYQENKNAIAIQKQNLKYQNQNQNQNSFASNNILFQNNNMILTKKEKLNEIKKIVDKYKHLYNINDNNKIEKLFKDLNQEL
jgi:hypothetical protein